jgi:hypothetical protein
VSYGLLSAAGLAPAWIERILIDEFAAKGSAIVTNVPGPGDRVRFAGAPVGGVAVWAPCSGELGISVSIFSYAGEVTVGLAVDASLVSEPHEIIDAFRQELGELATIAGHRRARTRATGRGDVRSQSGLATSPAAGAAR